MTSAGRSTAIFRFFGETNDFLPPRERLHDIVHAFQGTPSVKDRIETLGVPHTEVGQVRIDSDFHNLEYRLSGGERVEVFPAQWPHDAAAPPGQDKEPLNEPPPGEIRFVADVHLGRLTRLLRLLGFDTLYRNDYDDPHLARLSAEQERVLLTRDRRLLMRRQVRHAYFLRSDLPEVQVREVLRRYNLAGATRPFHRCSHCNGLVRPVSKASVISLLEPKTRRYYDSFWQCDQCRHVYWKGSHMPGLTHLLNRLEGLRALPT